MAFLQGCAAYPPTLLEGYAGAVATTKDRVLRIDAGKAAFFYLSHSDEGEINNSLFESF